MNKYLFILSLAALPVLCFSCKENFSPYGSTKVQYALSFVIRADTNFQTATLTRSYVSPDADPYSNTSDETVHGAVIRVWQDDRVSILRDTTVTRPLPTNYQNPYSVYYSRGLQPSGASLVEVEALLPNGKRLTSSSFVPDKVIFNSATTDTIIPMPGSGSVNIAWSASKSDIVTLPVFSIIYYVYGAGGKSTHKIVVPLNYVSSDNTLVPAYPKPSGIVNYYNIDQTTLNQAMQLISAGDPIKSNYGILIAQIDVYSFDQYLSLYYDGTVRSGDAYSVKLDATDYSNINGGLGIFGIYNKATATIRFSQNYIKSFGYVSALPYL